MRDTRQDEGAGHEGGGGASRCRWVRGEGGDGDEEGVGKEGDGKGGFRRGSSGAVVLARWCRRVRKENKDV